MKKRHLRSEAFFLVGVLVMAAGRMESVLAWIPSSVPPLSLSSRTTTPTKSFSSSSSSSLVWLAAEKNDFTSFPSDNDDEQPKLGIDISDYLDPLTEQEAAELKAAATEAVNDAVAAGLDDIEALRKKLKKELEQDQKMAQLKSERNAELAQTKLLSKIDKLTADFLKQNAASREQTKLASRADRAMEGKGLEVGVWGNLGGAAALMQPKATSSTAERGLGSRGISPTQLVGDTATTATSVVDTKTNGLIVLGDVDSDPYAKKLIPAVTKILQDMLKGDEFFVQTYKPTSTVPLGGDNANCALIFCTSFTDASTVKNSLERLLRRTISTGGGGVAQPPTQVVAVSTVGTERTNTMPYSMQNLMGGKLEKRRQMEEAIMNFVKQRENGIDYTICKLGSEIKDKADTFAFAPGDDVDGPIALDTASTVLTQAMAFHPSARNATLSCAGQLPPLDANEETERQDILDDAFLKLDGPEVLRLDLSSYEVSQFDQLHEYLKEWATLYAQSGKGLTTPIRADVDVYDPRQTYLQVQKQAALQLNFLPTATGRNYMSKEEERKREQQGSRTTTPILRANAKEGGLEFVVEITKDSALRVRAKRCNYGDDAVVKEISEETILSEFRKSIDVWKKDHQK